MNLLPAIPIISQVTFGALCLLFAGRPAVQKRLGVLASAILLAVSLVCFAVVRQEGVIALQVGAWPAPYGIALAIDTFSAVMLVMAGLMSFAVAIYSTRSMDINRVGFGYFALKQFLLMGVCGAILTTDLFNLFVWFEVTLLSSFVMLVHGAERRQLEGAMKYVTMNLIASVLFLSALGILYGKLGTLNMADLAVKLEHQPLPNLLTPLALLFFVSFGIKAAVFPMFFWLPASYHTAPIAVTALFSGLLTKMGVYAMIRVFTLVFDEQMADLQLFFLWVAGLTMVTGVLGAVAQYDLRRLLSFHIVSQIGYALMGFAILTPLSLAAAIYFLAHVILAKAALFLVGGVCYRIRGTYDLRELGAIYTSRPGLAVGFLLSALALAGIPPLSGFFAKFGLVRAAIESGAYAITATALVVSILTLFSMMKIWNEAFWKPAPNQDPKLRQSADTGCGRFITMQAPVFAIGILVIAMGLAAEPLFQVATVAAEQLLEPSEYITAVVGAHP